MAIKASQTIRSSYHRPRMNTSKRPRTFVGNQLVPKCVMIPGENLEGRPMEILMATALAGRFGGSVWGLLAISCIMAGLLLWIGAHLAGLKYVTLGRALLAAVAA